MHGFNRLGGNSVAETVVAGMIVGEYVADFCSSKASDVSIPTGLIREFVEREQKLDAMIGRSGGEDASAIKQQMQEVMSGKVGIFRTAELDEADACRSCSRAAATSGCVRIRPAPTRNW